MDRRRVGVGLGLAGALAIATLLLIGSLTGAYSGPGTDRATNPTENRTTVHIESSAGERLASVEVRVADDSLEREIGLSRTDHLGPREGMLFVHPRAGIHPYVMRNMDFPLDIVFIAANGTITRIHEAPVPEGSYERLYEGRGKYVLELNRGTTDEIGASDGDRVVIPNATG